jgi:hypothetical protein
MKTRTNYTDEARELLGHFVLRAGKNFLVIRANDVFQQPTTVKITPDDLAEFYATQAGNLLSGCRTLAGLTGDWRPISGLADTCLSWFKRVNLKVMRQAARKRGLEPRF